MGMVGREDVCLARHLGLTRLGYGGTLDSAIGKPR